MQHFSYLSQRAQYNTILFCQFTFFHCYIIIVGVVAEIRSWPHEFFQLYNSCLYVVKSKQDSNKQLKKFVYLKLVGIFFTCSCTLAINTFHSRDLNVYVFVYLAKFLTHLEHFFFRIEVTARIIKITFSPLNM